MEYIGTATEINTLLTSRKIVTLKPGKYKINEPILIPSGGKLEGSLNLLSSFPTELIVEDGNFPAVKFNGVNNAGIKNLQITRISPASSSECNGIYIWGQSITVENIDIKNASNGVCLKTDESIFNNQINLKNVNFSNDPAMVNAYPAFYVYGLQANTVTGLIVSNCNWEYAWLDGIKLRYKCSNVLIEKGSSSHNGLSLGEWQKDKCMNLRPDDHIHLYSGDGIDCYAGGEYITINNTRFEENGGNGVVIKTRGGPLAISDPNEFCGQLRHYQINNIVTQNNAGTGIAVEGVYNSTAAADKKPKLGTVEEDTRERATDIVINNCSFLNDHAYGLFLNGTTISVSNCEIKSSCLQGIRIGENAKGVTIDSCKITSCCRIILETGAKHPAITIEEKAENILIKNVFMDGKNDLLLFPSIIYLHQNAIVVNEDVNGISAEHVQVIGCTNINSEGGEGNGAYRPPVSLGPHVAGASTFIDHTGDKESPQGHIAAGLTSVYRCTADKSVWIKMTDEDNRRVYGWVKLA